MNKSHPPITPHFKSVSSGWSQPPAHPREPSSSAFSPDAQAARRSTRATVRRARTAACGSSCCISLPPICLVAEGAHRRPGEQPLPGARRSRPPSAGWSTRVGALTTRAEARGRATRSSTPPRSASRSSTSAPTSPLEAPSWHEYPGAQIDLVLELVKDTSWRGMGSGRTASSDTATIAPQRKLDPGPRFPWKRLDRGLIPWPDAENTRFPPTYAFEQRLPDIAWFRTCSTARLRGAAPEWRARSRHSQSPRCFPDEVPAGTLRRNPDARPPPCSTRW